MMVRTRHQMALQEPLSGAAYGDFVHHRSRHDLTLGEASVLSQYADHPPLRNRERKTVLIRARDKAGNSVGCDREAIGKIGVQPKFIPKLASRFRAWRHAGTTTCSIAPKIEWRLASRISIRTVSPAARNRVFGAPWAIVSTVRTSARHA